MVWSLFPLRSVLTVRVCSVLYTSYFIISQVFLCIQDRGFLLLLLLLLFSFFPFQWRRDRLVLGTDIVSLCKIFELNNFYNNFFFRDSTSSLLNIVNRHYPNCVDLRSISDGLTKVDFRRADS